MAKPVLELSARHAEVVQSALQHWLSTEAMTQSQAAQLSDTITIRGFDWEKFAKYTLRVSVICLFIAVTSILFERSCVKILKKVLNVKPWVRAGVLGLLATGVHVFAYEREMARRMGLIVVSGREKKFSYGIEAIHGVGGLVFALGAWQVLEQLGEWYEASRRTTEEEMNTGDGGNKEEQEEESGGGEAGRLRREKERLARRKLQDRAMLGVCLGLAVVYATVGLLSGSNFIWSCSMIVFGYCFGGSTIYGMGTYYLVMYSPVIFIIFGSSLIGVAHRVMRYYPLTEPLWSTTRIWGLLYVFIALWVLSLGHYDDVFDHWAREEGNGIKKEPWLSNRARMSVWSIVFFAASWGSIWHGLRWDDSTTKGFGLTFMGIYLYTKFFMNCWGWYKPLFFGVLAVSFGVIGRYAEEVWNMQMVRNMGIGL